MKNVKKQFADPSIVNSNSVLKEDLFLTNVVVGIRANQYVMDNILPEMQVKKDTDKIQVISPKGAFKPAARREETALPEQSAVQFDSDTYSCDEFALEGWVSDDAVRNAMVQTDPMAREAEFLTKRVFLTQEIGIISEIFSAVKAAGSTHYDILSGTTKWNGGASSAPLDDISTAIKSIVSRTGIRPNLTSMSTDAFEAFINNSQVEEILKHTSSALVEAATPIASIRGLRLQIADAVVNAGTSAVPVYRNIQYDVNTTTQMNDTVIVSFVAAGDPLTLGHNFVSKAFKAYTGRGLEGDRRQATLVAVWKKFGPKVTNVGAAHIIAKVLG
jgi:hypothetical protein